MHEPAMHAWRQLSDALRECQTSLETALAGPQQAVAAALEQGRLEISKVKGRRHKHKQGVLDDVSVRPLETSVSEVDTQKPVLVQRAIPLASLSVRGHTVDASGPADEAVRWLQKRLWECQHASSSALARVPGLGKEKEKAEKPEFLVRKNQTARLSRTLEFWKRSVFVYGSYKVRL
jgi:hypothetical protein